MIWDMATKTQPFEDVHSGINSHSDGLEKMDPLIELKMNGDIPASYVSLPEGKNLLGEISELATFW